MTVSPGAGASLYCGVSSTASAEGVGSGVLVVEAFGGDVKPPLGGAAG
jgi:hypothetical protein